jgi:hypothetical protein
MQDSSDARFAQLMRYISRGWALTPLHDVGGVPGGACSCRLGVECRSAGKHPRVEQWQRPENLVGTERALRGALERWPRCNWGLATGIISSCWALDYDPKAVDPARADEVATLLARCWESATWVQRTGSGGLHFLFALPEDFVPNNGSGRLPPGFDVRGARRGEAGGGQIVIAPSVSGTGSYELLADRPVTGPPLEVLDAVRPAPPRVGAPGATFTAAAADQAGAYVVAAVNGELAELRACWTSRNQRAWRAAARCIEMINTGLVGDEAVYAAWWAAGLAHPDRSVNVPDVELLRVWASAERHVGDRPADLSSVGGPASWWGGDAIRPSGAPPVPALGGGPGAAGGVSGYPQGVDRAVDNVATSGDRMATAQVNAGREGDQDRLSQLVAMIEAQLLDVEQLRALAPPVPLVNGVLDLETTAWLIGESGSYKSFVALDLAAHVGLGRPWRGRDVHQGDVVYVVAEGARGMRLRVDAWEREHGPMKNVRFLPIPVQAADRVAWSALAEVCRRVRPALVVVDTQARVTIGLDENSNSDMSVYAERVDEIKRATGACVLTVHHLGRNGTNARGASAIDGAQDAELRIRKTAQYAIELIMDKQKDQAEEGPMLIQLRRSEGGVDETTGRDLSSLVVDHALLGEPAGTPVNHREARARALYRILRDDVAGEGATRAEARKIFLGEDECAGLLPKSAAKAWQRAWGDLIDLGIVIKRRDRFRVLVLGDQGPAGWLTSNPGTPDVPIPRGWAVWWPDDEAEERAAQATRDRR